MKKLLILMPLLFFIRIISFGQLQINWQQSFGGSNYEDAQDILKSQDGYIVIGSTPSTDGEVGYNHGGSDYWLVWTDEMGNLLSEKTFGGSSLDYLYNGFYAHGSHDIYLAGVSASTDGDISYDPYDGEANLWIVRIDSAANIIWDRKVGSTIGLIYEQYIKPTSDGGVIASAQVDRLGGDVSTYYGGYDGWIIKLDSTGNTNWDFSIGTAAFEFINRVRQTSDGGYIAGLSGKPNGTDGNIDCQCINNSPDAILYKLDPDGNAEWHECYGGSNNDGIFDVLELDDGYLLAAHSRSTDGDLENVQTHGEMDVWIIRTNQTGRILWQKCFGGSNDDSPNEIFQTSDGDFIVFANTHSFDGDVEDNPSNSHYNTSIWVFKIDSEGELLWQQCIGGHAEEYVYGVTQHNDHEYSVAARMSYSPSGDVNCSNFVYGSGTNYWAFGLTDLTVGFSNNKQEINASVYPNPTKKMLTIRLEPNVVGKSTTIELFDLNGIKVMGLESIAVSEHLDVSNLNSGLYFLRIQTDKGLVIKKITIL